MLTALLYILASLILLLIVYLGILSLYAYTKQVRHDLAMLDLDRAQRRVHLTRPIWPDEGGVFPLLWDGLLALDPNRGVAFTIGGLHSVAPELTRPEQIARAVRAAGGWPQVVAGKSNELLPAPNVNWPSRVPLTGLLDGPPSFRDLVLGVTVKEDGQIEVVRADMGRLVHIAVGGSSGWGKSVFLRALAYQLAKSSDPVALVLIDLEGATFAPFQRCERLLWPVADTEADALAIFQELTEEMNRRKELYAQHPGIDSIRVYNAQADEPLTPVICLVDEATALLGDKSVESATRTLALRARKYGLWLVLGGQDWKASSLDTAIRNQLSSRIQFRAMSQSQSRILLQQAGAEDLDAPGRALAILPGRPLIELQAPVISYENILGSLAGEGPQNPMPVGDNGDGIDDEIAERIRAMWADGEGLGKIAEAVYGYRNARATAKIKEVLGLPAV